MTTTPAIMDTAMTTGPALLTEEQAAELLGLGAQTLANWRCTKRYALPFVRVGTRIRYRHADLLAWLDARTVRPGKS